MARETLLEVSDVRKHFGGLAALSGVSLDMRAGEVFGLLGPNGSGKTTLFNIVTGFCRQEAGHVVFDGEDISGWTPDRISRSGLVRTFQGCLNPERLTVMENMLLAPHPQAGESVLRTVFDGRRIRRDEDANRTRAWQKLELVRLAHQADAYVGELSGGQKKLLMLAQALMLTPKLVLLDEPVAGVNPKLVDEIVQIIRDLRADGQNFLVVEHNMSVVRRLCDRVCVLDAGTVIANGPVEETLGNDEVLRAYLGRRAG